MAPHKPKNPETFVENELTGAVRESKRGKGRFDLIPVLPLLRLAVHYENGGIDHGDRNWEKGLPLSIYYNSMIRHVLAYLNGDISEDHLAAILWNACGIIHHEEAIKQGLLPKELCDIPSRMKAIFGNG